MPIDHNVVRRLSFIKYLYQTATSQSKAPPPLNCASILTFHDAVELFLQLASEHLNAGAAKPDFMAYWELLNKKLDPRDLEQMESMRRLNKARVALKHHGTFPSDLDVEAFRASTTSFFQDNTPLVFGVALDEVSLVAFVNPESARKKLTEAQEQIQAGDTTSAAINIAVGFKEMIADYENRKRSTFGNSPFYFGRQMTFLSSFFMGLGRGSASDTERKLADFVDQAKESIEAMQNAIKMLSLGLDYRKFSRFQWLTPRVERMADGQLMVLGGAGESGKPSQDDARFCLNFVIESALILGEFDYTIDVGR